MVASVLLKQNESNVEFPFASTGVANWLFVFPIDTIKSRYQTDSLRAPRYAGIWDCVRQTVEEGRRQSVSNTSAISVAPSALTASSALSVASSAPPTASASSQALGVVRTLFRGYSACLSRAFVANAATFGAVELVHRWLPRREIK
jgi:hypothetical protein